MKILVQNYTFNKTTKQITFTDYNPIIIERVLLITNITDNIIIYNFANPLFGGTAATNVLTLTYDTSSMSNTDKLQIFYDDIASTQPINGTVAISNNLTYKGIWNNNIFSPPTANGFHYFSNSNGNDFLEFRELNIIEGGGTAFYMSIHRDLGGSDGFYAEPFFAGNHLCGVWNLDAPLRQYTDGAATIIGTVPLTCSPGDTVALEFNGTNFIAYKNGEIVDSVPVTITTDSNFSAIYTEGADTWTYSSSDKLATGAVTYAVNDVVTLNKSLYVAILGHTSSVATNPEIGVDRNIYWQLIESQKTQVVDDFLVPIDFAHSAQQLPDNHNVTVSNMIASVETGLATSSNQDTINDSLLLLRQIAKILYNTGNADGAKRQNVVINLSGTAVTTTLPVSGTVTATANINQIGGIDPRFQIMDMSHVRYATCLRNNLSFT